MAGRGTIIISRMSWEVCEYAAFNAALHNNREEEEEGEVSVAASYALSRDVDAIDVECIWGMIWGLRVTPTYR